MNRQEHKNFEQRSLTCYLAQYEAGSSREKKGKWALTRPTNKQTNNPDTFPVSAALAIPIRHKAHQQGHFITGIPTHTAGRAKSGYL